MWGIHDNTLLRRLVYIALVEDDQEFIRKRWKKERQQLDANVPDGGVDLTEEVLQNILFFIPLVQHHIEIMLLCYGFVVLCISFFGKALSITVISYITLFL